MANTLKFGAGKWATGNGTALAYNDENGNFKPLPFTFTRNSKATVVNHSGLIEEVGAGDPRIDFLGNTEGAMLLEPQRTNILTYSEDFSNSNWINQSTDTTLSVVSSGSPNGGAFYRCTSGSNGGGRIVDVFSGSLTGGVFSLYAKGSGSLRIDLFINGGGNIIKNITLTSEWKKYDVYNPQTNNNGDVSIRFFANSVADIFGAQLESGTYPTSYIPTQGSAVTRLVDKCISAGNNQVIKSTEGTIYAEQKSLETNFTYNYFVAVSDGTNNNRLEIRQTADAFQFLWRVGGTYQSQIVLTNAPFTSVIKFALRYSSANIKFYVNGSLVGTLNSPTLYASGVLKNIEFADGSGGTNFRGTVKNLKYYNTALTDQELIALTQV